MADYGSTTACCDQEGDVTDELYQCAQETPVCNRFTSDTIYGVCAGTSHHVFFHERSKFNTGSRPIVDIFVISKRSPRTMNQC